MADEKLPLWRRWWVRTAAAGIFTVIAWVTQVQLGETLPTAVRVALLVAVAAALERSQPVRHARVAQP